VTVVEPVRATRLSPRRVNVVPGSRIVRWVTSTDHKVIGLLYLITSFIFFLIGGLMAEVMRTELARPGL
jgi:cytochrome c oxidase subunit I